MQCSVDHMLALGPGTSAAIVKVEIFSAAIQFPHKKPNLGHRIPELPPGGAVVDTGCPNKLEYLSALG